MELERKKGLSNNQKGLIAQHTRDEELERKKGLSNKQKGLIIQHTGEDTSQQQRDIQLQVVKESTTAYKEPNKIF